MDIIGLFASGYVGKCFGWKPTKRGQCYKFSLAVNKRIGGKTVSSLWLQCHVYGSLAELCAERGIYQGEKLLIVSDSVELFETMHEGKPRAWLNIVCSQVNFVSEVAVPQITRVGGTAYVAKGSKVS